jgi:TRAP-type C4-dicarboxylate transport system permease large subunit
VGATGAFIICLLRRKLTLATLHKALFETLKTSGLIYLVIIGALVFAAFVSVTGLTDTIAQGIAGLGLGPVGTMLLVAVFLLPGFGARWAGADAAHHAHPLPLVATRAVADLVRIPCAR